MDIEKSTVITVAVPVQLRDKSLTEIYAAIDSAFSDLMQPVRAERNASDERRFPTSHVQTVNTRTWQTETAMMWIEKLPWPQSEAARRAIQNGGVITRAEVYQILGARESERSLTGFTRPFSRIALDLSQQGYLPPAANLEPVGAFYTGGNTAAGFRVIDEVVEAIQEGR